MNPLVIFLNTYGVFLLMGIAVFYPVMFLGNKQHMLVALVTIASVTVVTVVLKELFALPRPFLIKELPSYAGLSHFSSFPSSHTALAFAAATNITFRERRLGVLLLIFALFVGIGRVFANVHYPVDIVFGMLIGIVIAYTIETFHLSTQKHTQKRKTRV